MLTPIDDAPAWAATRTARHTLAERVLAPARHAATGRIGLAPAPGGFATPPGDGGPALAVDGNDLVVGPAGDAVRHPLTTLGDAAALVGLASDAGTGVYTATTPSDPATRVAVDPALAATLAEWFAFGERVLCAWTAEHADDTPAAIQLWPEHFDLATDLGPESGRANYGASPGDAGHELPYLYVGPWTPTDDPFWDAGTYARLGYEQLAGRDDAEAAALAFFRAGYAAATRGSNS